MNISVIGLGKLGLCTAACFSAKGYNVLGVDINPQYVDAVNRGVALIHEPKLQELIDQSKGRLHATKKYDEAIQHADITFLIVPTPSQPDGHFSNQYLKDAIVPLAEALKHKQGYHIFVVTSTVSPGMTNKILIPLLEQHSGKVLNRDFGVAYNPEFIALGSVISDFLKPDMVLIGESEQRVGDVLEKIYQTTCDNDPYIARMSLVSAEIAKISLNSYITMKISFANTIANVCEEITDANIDDITKALGADKRISPHYLKGGLGFGGPCFPRDNRAFSAFAADYGVDAKLAKATDEVNQVQNQRLAEYVMNVCWENKTNTVAVCGLSYKPNTPVIEESPGVKLVEQLLKKEMDVIVYDPLAMESAQKHFNHTVRYAKTIQECFAAAKVAVFTTGDVTWKTITQHDFKYHPTILIDCWRIFDANIFSDKAIVLRMGDKMNHFVLDNVLVKGIIETVV